MNYKYVKLLRDIVNLECKKEDINEELFNKEMELREIKEMIKLQKETDGLIESFCDDCTYENYHEEGILVVALLVNLTGEQELRIATAMYDPDDDSTLVYAKNIAVKDALDLLETCDCDNCKCSGV